MEIRFSYQPELKEMANATRYMLFNKPLVKLLLIFVFGMIGLSVFSAIYFKTNEYWKSAFNGLILVFIWLVIYGYTMWSVKRNLTDNPKNKEIQHLCFDLEGIDQKGDSFHIHRKWSEILKIKETKNWFFIYVQRNAALPIFKSKLQPEEIIALRDLIKKLPIKKKLL
ncbi:MAG: hypothetical protein RLZZ500_462 [Bacteroidota bacterium]|jgi:uncharacterized membrane protein YqjE